jgi:predicted transcriptional regulator of viral defense system
VLRSAGVRVLADQTTKPKQTNATRRWKVQIAADDLRNPVRTKIDPVAETREAATRLRTSSSNATHILRSAERAGLVRHLRHGLWAIDPTVDPNVVAPYLTVPYPAYISLWSALAHHDMIEQIPSQIYVASLDRTREIHTSIGDYSVHHLAPGLFGGFTGDPNHGYIASPEKALFDTFYIRAPRGGRAFFPEITLPEEFRHSELETWTQKVPSPRMRTLVKRGLQQVLTQSALDLDS